MSDILFLLLDFIVIFFAAYVINKDISSRNLDEKIFFLWMIGLVIGYFFQGMLGVLFVFIAYLIWSWLFNPGKREKTPDIEESDMESTT